MKETPRRLTPTKDTLNKLFAKSSNQCAFPKCKHELVDENNEFVAQVCHIEAAEKGGERFNPVQTNEGRRSINNLVLFCYKHHKITNDVIKYSKEKLWEIKKEHESKSGSFQVPEKIIYEIFNDFEQQLKSIKDDTSDIKRSIPELEKQLTTIIEDVKEISSSAGYLDEIERIDELRKDSKFETAFHLLVELEKRNWSKLNDYEKYKVLAHKGIYLIELGKEKEAAKYLIQALTFNHEDLKALSLASFGYFIVGDKENAENCITRTLKIDPLNINANIALIAISNDEPIEELLTKIPKEIKEKSEIAFALGGYFNNKNDFENAILWYQKALDTSDSNKSLLKGTLATCMLQSITDPFKVATGQLDIESKNKVHYAINLLEEAWDADKITELAEKRSSFLLNKGIAYKYLKNLESAFKDIEEAYKTNSIDKHFIRHYGIVLFELGKLDESYEIFEKLKENAEATYEVNEIDLIQAQILYSKEEFSAAIKSLERIIEETSDEKIVTNAEFLLLDSYVQEAAIEKAKELINGVISNNPNEIRSYLLGYKYHYHTKNDIESHRLLVEAYNKVTPETSKIEVSELADALAINGLLKESCELLEKITDLDTYSDQSLKLLNQYFNSGEKGKALDLCNRLKEAHGPLKYVTELQSYIYESINDFSNAIKVCEDHLDVYPDDQYIKIRLAFIYAGIDKLNEAKVLVDQISFEEDFPLIVLYRLAYLYHQTDDLKTGLDIAYNTRKKFFNVSEAHLKYIGFLTQLKVDLDKIFVQEKITIDNSIVVQNEDGKTSIFTIVEAPDITDTEQIAPDEHIASVLLEKKVGDKVVIPKRIGGDQTIEIIGISSKYTHAFRQSLELLNTRFTDVQDFRVLTFQNTGDINVDMKPILDELKKDESYEEELRNLYTEKHLSVCMLSVLKNENVVKTWSIAVNNPKFGVFSSHGIVNEGRISNALLRRGANIVIDITSILTGGQIDILKFFEDIDNNLIITYKTVQTIEEIVHEYSGIASDGFMTIGRYKGRLTHQSYSKKEIEDYTIKFQDLLVWLKSNCQILPVNEALSTDSILIDTMERVLSKSFAESVLLAKEHNALLFSDDETLRQLAYNEFKINGLSNYYYLTYLRSEQLIDQNVFDEKVANLISLNYRFLPINASILHKCAKTSGYQDRPPFALALETLHPRISTEDSAIRVAVDFLYKFLAESQIVEIRTNVVLILFNTLIQARNPFLVFEKIKIISGYTFKLLIPQRDEMLQIMKDYLKTLLK